AGSTNSRHSPIWRLLWKMRKGQVPLHVSSSKTSYAPSTSHGGSSWAAARRQRRCLPITASPSRKASSHASAGAPSLRVRIATVGLTAIANRRTFESTLEREIARAQRHSDPVSLVMVDIDHFKALNDSNGHQAGDDVLRNVAAALACECREFDLAARYGGEEF